MSSAASWEEARQELKKIPQHVAIILDGNGRWARNQGLSRSMGHRAGGENLDRLLETVLELKIPLLSLYAFSTENWRRPTVEIKSLWELLGEFFQTRLERCRTLDIQIRISGNLSLIPAKSRAQLEEAAAKTTKCRKLIANFCINYGSHEEIVQACDTLIQKRLALYQEGKKAKAKAALSREEFEKELYTCGLPPVDLLVRTGGEMRISNFLLWQSAYAEFYVTETLWPDFQRQELLNALLWFQRRHRRFGGL